MADSQKNQDKYEQLLNELSKSRDELTEMISDVDKCKETILGVAANTTDYRNRYSKEDRLKTITSFYSTLLALRQEYNRNIISEIELRRKLEKGDDGEVELDIAKIAKQMEALSKKKDSTISKLQN